MSLMSTFKPIAPIEPDQPFDEDAYDAMIAAMDELIGEPSTVELEEAFNVNQPRFPKGHARAGQWRPKLVTGAGRVAPGHLDRDLHFLNENIKAINTTYRHARRRLGSTTSAPRSRRSRCATARARPTRNASLTSRPSARRSRTATGRRGRRFFHDPQTTPEMVQDADMKDYVDPADSQRLTEILDEEIRLMRQRDHADRDAMLGVLQKIRPMGGTLKQDDTVALDRASGIEREYIENHPGESARGMMASDLNESLKQVLKVVPKAWLDDTNAKGRVSWLMSKDRAYASTVTTEPKRPADQFRTMENAVDQALKGELPEALTAQAAGNVADALNDPYPGSDATPETKDAWRARRDEHRRALASQRYTWVGRAGSPQNPNYPKGLWAVLRGAEDKRDYYVDWGGNLHLMRPPVESDSPVTRANLTMQVQEGKRDDRRLTDVPITTKQQTEITNAIANGGSYEGMYDGRYPVIRRPGTEEGGVGPNAAIYDWVDDKGAVKNLQVDDVAPDKKFDPAKWDRQAPRPAVQPSSTDTIIRVDPRNRSTVLHELSHRLENVYGTENPVGYNPISFATHAWLAKRAGDEPVQKLADLYPTYAYDDHEMTRPDKFVDGYIGKLYPGQATEVLTMGMEMLWFPSHDSRNIDNDPDMRRLILGILATV